MKVKELMQSKVWSCRLDDTLNRAAHLMWEGDCGALPIVRPDGNVVGMITDRDVCIAAYTKGRPLTALKVEDAMAQQVTSCSTDASVETAMSLMKEVRVRRLPIVDAQGKLAGILSLNDLACMARKQANSGGKELKSADVAETLGVICEPRRAAATASKPSTQRAGNLVGAAL